MQVPSGTNTDPGKKIWSRPRLTWTLGQVFKNTENHPKSNLVFGSKLGRRLSISQNSTAVLNHFSARVFLSLIFQPQIGRFCSKLRKKHLLKKGCSFWESFVIAPAQDHKMGQIWPKTHLSQKGSKFWESFVIAPAQDHKMGQIWTKTHLFHKDAHISRKKRKCARRG